MNGSSVTAEEVEQMMKELGLDEDNSLKELQNLIDRDKQQASELQGLKGRLSSMNKRIKHHNKSMGKIKKEVSKANAKANGHDDDDDDDDDEGFGFGDDDGGEEQFTGRHAGPTGSSPSQSPVHAKTAKARASRASKASQKPRRKSPKSGRAPARAVPSGVGVGAGAGAGAGAGTSSKSRRSKGAKVRANKRPPSLGARPATQSNSVYKQAAAAILSGRRTPLLDDDDDNDNDDDSQIMKPPPIDLSTAAFDDDMYGSDSDSASSPISQARLPKRVSSPPTMMRAPSPSPRVWNASQRLDAAMAAFGPVPPSDVTLADPDISFEPRTAASKPPPVALHHGAGGGGSAVNVPGFIRPSSRPDSRKSGRSGRPRATNPHASSPAKKQQVPRAKLVKKRVSRKRAALDTALRESSYLNEQT